MASKRTTKTPRERALEAAGTAHRKVVQAQKVASRAFKEYEAARARAEEAKPDLAYALQNPHLTDEDKEQFGYSTPDAPVSEGGTTPDGQAITVAPEGRPVADAPQA